MPGTNRPIVGITMGDAAGIGPEIIAKALEAPETVRDLNALVIGDAGIMRKAIELVAASMRINVCLSAGEADFSTGVMNVIDLANLPEDAFGRGVVDPAIGRAAVQYTERAVEMALAGEIDAIVSAPMNKEAMHRAGYDFSGGTELLGHLTNCNRFTMVLMVGPMRLFYVSNHVSMREALESIKKEVILDRLRQVNEALAEFGIREGRIAVAAFNPHGGEGGAMGREEIDEIAPAIEAAQGEAIGAHGPYPADTIFVRGKKGEFDAILAMYHDQGNIAAKLMGFGAGVTVVAGLPIIRTSVAHGTAFDIAGRGIASAQTLIAAIQTAGEVARERGRVH